MRNKNLTLKNLDEKLKKIRTLQIFKTPPQMGFLEVSQS